MSVTENFSNIEEEKAKEDRPEEEPAKIIPQPPQQKFPKEVKPPEELLPKEEIGTEEKVKEEKALPKKGPIFKKKTKKVRKRKKGAPVVHKSKMVKIDGRYVFMIPSGFEIKTSEGWRPVMMRADKISTGK